MGRSVPCGRIKGQFLTNATYPRRLPDTSVSLTASGKVGKPILSHDSDDNDVADIYPKSLKAER